MVEIKTDAALDAMRVAGRVVADALAAARAAAAPGVRLLDLDEAAHTVLREAGAKSPFLGYQPSFASTPFPAVLCVSVNDAIVHGVPNATRLRDGDLVSIDCGALVDGWAGDAALSFTVGTARAEDQRLMDTTRRALEAGIAAAVVGARIGDISHAIGSVGRAAGYGIPRDFGGHGIGRQMHEDPSVPNDGRPHRGFVLRHGLVLAIEPMFLAGGKDFYAEDGDGWTLRTTDASRAAHFEHTVAVTDEGPRVLTAA
ncbi:type I methionyl aminopeptidase [Streptomyces sp. DSM 41527]|uniref:Methionine aminopeptidase n=1 Tax=Streptomyces mooreae TaxID=3075523 RepID=A0ABU2TGZ0_9ACTN|nr:type I methionyl aminopeptidase [Streptomyces sp. DSM 41527]MDT0460169.1 type I methionyl aminopeptidase [Streptomyces sp. DSM 41527]